MRFNNTKIAYSALYLVSILLSACGGGGGGGGGPVPTSHAVNISWTANREAAVNSAGGGYTVSISNATNAQSPINVPYVSGPAAPATIATTLMSGSYSVTVTAYSALNPTNGSMGSTPSSTSLPSATFNFSVPY